MRPVELSVVLLALATQVAHADRFYVGVDLGVAVYDGVASATDAASSCSPGCIGEEISVNGLEFDSNETTWGLFAGWQVLDWLAIELTYSDLGEPAEEIPITFSGYGPSYGTPLITPQININYPAALPLDVGAFAASAVSVPTIGYAALSVEEISVSAKFRKQLSERFTANWLVGITEASFDTRGQVQIPVYRLVGSSLIRTEIERTYIPPESEYGLVWGLGVEWHLTQLFSLDLGYRRHDTQVIDIDTVSLRLLVTF